MKARTVIIDRDGEKEFRLELQDADQLHVASLRLTSWAHTVKTEDHAAGAERTLKMIADYFNRER